MSNRPWARGEGDWYPPSGVPAPPVTSILGDSRPEIVVPMTVQGSGKDCLLWPTGRGNVLRNGQGPAYARP